MNIRRDEIRALVWEWSPLGDDDPHDPHLPRDEYDWLVSDVERKLGEGVDVEQLSAYMTDAVRSPLRRLHGAQAVTTFSQIDSPPFDLGTMWSSVSRPLVVPQ